MDHPPYSTYTTPDHVPTTRSDTSGSGPQAPPATHSQPSSMYLRLYSQSKRQTEANSCYLDWCVFCPLGKYHINSDCLIRKQHTCIRWVPMAVLPLANHTCENLEQTLGGFLVKSLAHIPVKHDSAYSSIVHISYVNDISNRYLTMVSIYWNQSSEMETLHGHISILA